MDADRTVAQEEARRKIVEAMFRKIREEAQARPQKMDFGGLFGPTPPQMQLTMAKRG
jgi:hypothetical protein